MKTNELTGALLALWVARALGYELVSDPVKIGEAVVEDRAPVIFYGPTGKLGVAGLHLNGEWKPNEDWSQGGPIIDRERIALDPITRDREDAAKWQAQIWRPYACHNDASPLVAAMRAYVASKYGDEVPDEAQP